MAENEEKEKADLNREPDNEALEDNKETDKKISEEAAGDNAKDNSSADEAAGDGQDKGTDDKASGEDDPPGAEGEKKTGFFDKRKKDKKDKRDTEIDELKDRLMRQMAEFDNYRKRTDKEKKKNYEVGASDFITKILPVVDNFERALDSVPDEEKDSGLAQGVGMIYKQLAKVLEDEGVTVIETEGKEFDPMLHNAVMQQENEDYESGFIIQELQKGYMYKDKVIRHSMVIVAK